MRVLFSSTPGVGHVFPMLPLARAFLDSGHEVLWATGEEATGLLDGIPAAACGGSGPDLAARRATVMVPGMQLPPPERRTYVFSGMFGGVMAPLMAADLLPLAREWGPDVLVHEQAELAAPLVGAVLERPSVTHSFGGAVPADGLTAAGQQVEAMWTEQGLEVPPYAGCFSTLYLDICPPSVQPLPVAHIREIQPLRPVTAGPGEPRTPPLVYVTMGTVQNRALQLGPLVAAVAQLPVEVLVAVGRNGETDLGPLPGNVRVERWVDQTQVLGTAAVVVSHGGSGTFLGALAQGVPQLCLPQAADQFDNARAGTAAGASLALMPDQISPAAVATAVEQLLADGEVRAGAQRVADEIAAMPSPDDVCALLEERFG